MEVSEQEVVGNGRGQKRATPRVAIVAAGAGARGAFEAGALSIVVPWLDQQGLRPTIFVGTSAGSINAAMLASTAHLNADDAAEELLALWRGLTLRRVYHSPLLGLPGTARSYLGQVLGLPRSHVISVLDTAPLHSFFRSMFEPWEGPLRNNITSGRVAALATVTTDAASRTTVFTDLAPGAALPAPNLGRAIEYRAAAVRSEHVLASCAIPALFRPVEIDGAFYTDGGVRLNVPIAPALALGATHVAVVATHPDSYPPTPLPATRAARVPDLVDAVVSLFGTVLADRMVEDLHTLQTINGVLRGRRPTKSGPRHVANLFVGPATRHEIGELAAQVYRERYRGRRVVTELDFRVLHRLLGPREAGDGDVLSYLFFDEAFLEQAIELGQRYARAVISQADPWN